MDLERANHVCDLAFPFVYVFIFQRFTLLEFSISETALTFSEGVEGLVLTSCRRFEIFWPTVLKIYMTPDFEWLNLKGTFTSCNLWMLIADNCMTTPL